MANLTNIYSDLDLTFNAQPVTGDVSLVLDNRAVISSVKNLLSTNYYDRLWQSELGSNLTALLFENVDAFLQTTIASEIQTVITNFEPRVTIESIVVTAQPDQNGYYATLTFFIGNNTTPTQVTAFLERIR